MPLMVIVLISGLLFYERGGRIWWIWRFRLCGCGGAGNQRAHHGVDVAQKGIRRLHRWMRRLGAVHRKLDIAGEFCRRHAGGERNLVAADRAADRCRDLCIVQHGIMLVEVARLDEMFGEQLLDMRRTGEGRDHRLQPRCRERNHDVGQRLAGALGLFGRGLARGERVLMHALDHSAEQRFL